MSEKLLTGWGLTAATRADVTLPTTAEEARAALAAARANGGGIIARGLGRAYGDAAQSAGGHVIDLTALARVHHFEAGDATSATSPPTITVDAGLSLDALMRTLVPLGYFVPVTAGTRYVTVGGAFASDIHGKNHHVEGSFSQHVTELSLLLASGEVRALRPDGPTAPAFWATAGGMGLTGIILATTIRLLPITSAYLRVDTERVDNLDDCMRRMSERDDEYRYSVAWIDSLATGSSMGRAVLTRGDHADPAELSRRKQKAPLAYAPTPRLSAPPWVPPGLLRPATVHAFNEVWFRKSPRRHTGYESIPFFFHPLDGVLEWNRIYGRSGFIQYQLSVPLGAEETVRQSLGRLSAARCPSFLTVLKRFGPANPGPLSFPQPGWTLTVDVPAALEGLGPLLDGLDEMVVAAGGRIYLSKDSRLRSDLLPAMYPRLDEWRAARDELDPDHVFSSDLSRRLGLT